MTDCCIALLTFNGEKYLSQVLEMISRQKLSPREILAIDSGSTDSTLDILRKSHVSIHQIPQNEFSHPRTRNLAARLCSGRYLVFLTQDATPADNCWLDRLLEPFQTHSDVAGSFSRHVPRPAASLLEANDLHLDFPQIRLLKHSQTNINDFWRLIKFSNSSAAYDRNLLIEHPFDEQLPMAEDQEWAWRMIQNGFTIAYEPDSVVLHSHNLSLREKYERSLRMGRSFASFLHQKFGKRSTLLETGAWLNHLLLDLRYVASCEAALGTKLKSLALSPAHRFVTHYAFRKGWNTKQNGFS